MKKLLLALSVLLVLISVSCDSDPYIVGQVKNEKELRNALAEAKDGDSILIKAGSYSFSESVDIDRELKLYVEGGKATFNFSNKENGVIATEKLGNGDLTISNIDINGKLTINGGGSNSIHLENVEVDSVEIAKEGVEPPRLVIEGNTEIQQLTITTNAIIDVQTDFNENEPPIKKTEITNKEVEVTLENAQSNAFGEMSDESKDNISCTQWDGVSKTTDWYSDSLDTYTLNSASDLAGFAQLVNDGVSFDNKTVNLDIDIDLNNKEWTPIGTKDNPFKGIFNGNNCTISNLQSLECDSYVGLFGDINNPCKIFNLNIHNVNLKGVKEIGAIVGASYTGSISECKVTGDIKIEGNYHVGGIAGNGYAQISNCTVIGNTDSYIKCIYNQADLEGDAVGGIIGYYPEGNNDLTGCVVKNISVEGTRKVGGIVGHIGYSSGDRKVSNCVFKGNVSSNADENYRNDNNGKLFVGGIVGEFTTGSNDAEKKIEITKCTVEKGSIISGFDKNTTGIVCGGSRTNGAIINLKDNNTDGIILDIKDI